MAKNKLPTIPYPESKTVTDHPSGHVIVLSPAAAEILEYHRLAGLSKTLQKKAKKAQKKGKWTPEKQGKLMEKLHHEMAKTQ